MTSSLALHIGRMLMDFSECCGHVFCVCARDARRNALFAVEIRWPVLFFSPLQYLFTIRRCSGLSDEKVIGLIFHVFTPEVQASSIVERERVFFLDLANLSDLGRCLPVLALERSPVRLALTGLQNELFSRAVRLQGEEPCSSHALRSRTQPGVPRTFCFFSFH